MKRKQQNWVVITFPTTAAAFQFEHTAKEHQHQGRLIPVPKQISAGCGLAWRNEPEELEQLQTLLQTKHLEYQQIQMILL